MKWFIKQEQWRTSSLTRSYGTSNPHRYTASFTTLYVRSKILNSILRWNGRQCSVLRTGLICHICLTISWRQVILISVWSRDLTPLGHKVHHIPRTSRGGSVSVLLKSSFVVTPEDSVKALSFENRKLYIKVKSFSIHLVTVYIVPPKKNGLLASQFQNEFPEIIDHLSILNGRPLIGVDVNVH